MVIPVEGISTVSCGTQRLNNHYHHSPALRGRAMVSAILLYREWVQSMHLNSLLKRHPHNPDSCLLTSPSRGKTNPLSRTSQNPQSDKTAISQSQLNFFLASVTVATRRI